MSMRTILTHILSKAPVRCLQMLVAISLILAASDASAQKSKHKVADKLFRSFNYEGAKEIYVDIIDSKGGDTDTLAMRRLVECHMKTGNLSSAESVMSKVVTLTKNNPKDVQLLADIKRRQGRYAEASMMYESCAQAPGAGPMAGKYAAQPSFAEMIMRDSSIYTIISLQSNSEGSDFAPSFFQSNQVVFSSARPEGLGGKKQYLWNGQPYLNVYTSLIKMDSTLDVPSLLSNTINSRYHEGSMSYDYRSNTMYFTRNNFLRGKLLKSESGQLNLAIFTSEYKDGEWGPLKPFDYNNKEYSTGHPSINGRGERMYFASDMPGGKGGTDIWYCDRKNSEWGAPVNAGPLVNTPGNELFPFAVGDSTLYFASDGHVGLGGLDVFFVSGLTSDEPMNMGYPVNTRYDDFGVAVFPNEMNGYFCSNRPGGKGDDDIYMFKLHPPDSLYSSGFVLDETSRAPISGARVWVQNPDGSVSETLSDNSGAFKLASKWNSDVRFNSSKKQYMDGELDVKPSPRSAYLDNLEIAMKKFEFVSRGKVLLAENNQPAAGAVVRARNQKGEVVDSVTVDKNGFYFLPLAEGPKYTIEASMKDYVTLTVDVDSSDPSKKDFQYDFKLFKPEKGTIVRLDNIYYDYDKADIRPDAAKELDKLVKILNDFPTMKIELSSHTDCRGSDSYNLKLSERRAKSAVDYIISQGISKSRLVNKGYGETKLLNKCDDGVNCTEDEHSYNRRTEFKILDI
ncbi:MAG: hypothetical protein RL220_1470 [Bacteroidota bacterium]